MEFVNRSKTKYRIAKNIKMKLNVKFVPKTTIFRQIQMSVFQLTPQSTVCNMILNKGVRNVKTILYYKTISVFNLPSFTQ